TPLLVVGSLFSVLFLTTLLVYVHRIGRYFGRADLSRSVVRLGWYLGVALFLLFVFLLAIWLVVPGDADPTVWDRSYHILFDLLVAIGAIWLLSLLVRLAALVAAPPQPPRHGFE